MLVQRNILKSHIEIESRRYEMKLSRIISPLSSFHWFYFLFLDTFDAPHQLIRFVAIFIRFLKNSARNVACIVPRWRQIERHREHPLDEYPSTSLSFFVRLLFASESARFLVFWTTGSQTSVIEYKSKTYLDPVLSPRLNVGPPSPFLLLSYYLTAHPP